MYIKSAVTLFVAMSAFSPAKATGVHVGTGGDAIDAYLEEARGSMVNTLKTVLPDQAPDLRTLRQHCTDAGSNRPEQVETCVRFLLTTAQAIIDCNIAANPTTLVPIRVEDGDEFFYAYYRENESEVIWRQVNAKTKEGCSAPIYFDYKPVRDLQPD